MLLDVLLLVWLADVLDNFKNVLLMTITMGGIPYIGYTMYSLIEPSKKPKFLKTALSIFIVSGIMLVILPSSKLIYASTALYIGKTAVETDVGKKALSILEDRIEKELKKISEEK